MKPLTVHDLHLLRKTGLGDRIERVAQPIARAIDKIAGTKVAKCGKCKKMRDRLNAGMSLREAIRLRVQGK